jgi:hypothetical protein
MVTWLNTFCETAGNDTHGDDTQILINLNRIAYAHAIDGDTIVRIDGSTIRVRIGYGEFTNLLRRNGEQVRTPG